MNTVYIVNQPLQLEDRNTYDVTPASRYGAIEYIFPHSFGPASANPDDAVAHATEVLAQFNPDTDYLVWAGGDPLANIIVAGILADITNGKFTFLKWSKHVDPAGYVPVPLDIFAAMETNEDE